MESCPTRLIDQLEPGMQIGRYQVQRLLARGGMAEIYLVKSVGMHDFESLAVLKRLPPHCLISEPSIVNMFFDEARLTASLRHPNIAQVYDLGEDDESFFFVMEYVDGLNIRQLQKLCQRQGTDIPLGCALQIVLGVAEGLHSAHEACSKTGEPLHIVHRDVSPQNILVTREGGIKLIDFGIAHARKRLVETQTGVVKGKFAYMSPEQCLAEPVTRLSDLYALGVLLFELTTGTRPHGSLSGPEILQRLVETDSPDPRTRNPELPEELALIINTLLERDPAKRFQTARHLHEALSRFCSHSNLLLSPFELANWVRSLAADHRKIGNELNGHISRAALASRPADLPAFAAMSGLPRMSTRAATLPHDGRVGQHEAAGLGAVAPPALDEYLILQRAQDILNENVAAPSPVAPRRIARGTTTESANENLQTEGLAEGAPESPDVHSTSAPYDEIILRSEARQRRDTKVLALLALGALAGLAYLIAGDAIGSWLLTL